MTLPDLRRSPARAGRVLLPVAAALLAVLVVLLALENRRLEAELARHAVHAAERSATLASASYLPGDQVGPFALRDAGGALEDVAFEPGGPRSLLLFRADDCDACAATLPAWESLAAAARTAGVRVLAVELDRSAPLPAADEDVLGVRHLARAADLPLAKLTRVPLTALALPDGTLEQVRYGALDDAWSAEFHARLVGER